MYGYGFLRCRTPIARRHYASAPWSDRRLGNKLERDIIENRRAWVNLEGAIYTSGTKDQENTPYEAFHTNMLSFEPMVEVASKSSGDVRFFHGAGLACHFLFGRLPAVCATPGSRCGPSAVEIGDHWEFAFNVRYYPNGFGADQFGFEGALPTARSFEHTWGFTVAWKL